MSSKRLIVGITGASAPIYGIRTLEILRRVEIETHLVLTKAAMRVIDIETDWTVDAIKGLADFHYRWDDFAASISSGSFPTGGMIVAPCSINTMAAIAASLTKDLLCRAADVTLKESRPLVLMVRESPLHAGHLRRMLELTEMGAVIAPPIPSFYHLPENVTDLVDHSIGRALDLLGIEAPGLKRWRTPD